MFNSDIHPIISSRLSEIPLCYSEHLSSISSLQASASLCLTQRKAEGHAKMHKRQLICQLSQPSLAVLQHKGTSREEERLDSPQNSKDKSCSASLMAAPTHRL